MLRIWHALRRPYAARLVFWTVFLSLSAVALRVVADPHQAWRNPVGHALLEVCGVLLAGSIAYSLWVQYCVSAKHSALFGTIAFTGLMIGGLVQAIASAAAFGSWTSPQELGFHYYAGWKLAAGCILIAAALSNTRRDKSNARNTGLRQIAGWLVISFALAATAVIFGRSWPAFRDASASILPKLLDAAVRFMLLPLPMHIIGLAVTATALVVFVQRYGREEDAFSDGVARCLAVVISSEVATLVSARDYDAAWWASHALGMLALLVLLIQLAREFGESYAKAQARIEHLEAVHRLSSQLSTTLDLRVVLLVLVSDIADMLSARHASVMMADEAGETLTAVATHGLPESPFKSSGPQKVEGSGRPGFYSGHTARAFREKRVCIVDDVFTDVEFIPWRLLAWCDGYVVSAPLVYQDVGLGVLDLFFDKHVPLNDETIRLYETLASAAAVAIANAQLYEKTLEAQEPDVAAASLFRAKLAS